MKSREEAIQQIKKYHKRLILHTPVTDKEVMESILYGYNLALQYLLNTTTGQDVNGVIQGVVFKKDIEKLIIESLD